MYNLSELNGKTDLELVNDVKSNCSDNSFLELVDRHGALFTSMVNKFSGRFQNSGISLQDVSDEKYNVFYEAINTFDPDKKTKFSSWLGQCVKYNVLNYVYKDKNVKNRANFVYSEDFENEDQHDYYLNLQNAPFEELDSQEDQCYKLDLIMDTVKEIAKQENDERIENLFEYRFYTNDKKVAPWREVGEKLGFTSQAALNMYRRSVKKVKNKIQEQKIVDNLVG